MATVINPGKVQGPNYDIAAQLLAAGLQAQAKRKDERLAADVASAENDLKAMPALDMLQTPADSADADANMLAVQRAVGRVFDARAAQQRRKLSPEEKTQLVQDWIQQYSEGALGPEAAQQIAAKQKRLAEAQAAQNAPTLTSSSLSTSSSASGSAAGAGGSTPQKADSSAAGAATQGFGADQETISSAEGAAKTSLDVGTLKQNFYDEVAKQYGFTTDQLKNNPSLASQVEMQFKQYADENRLNEAFANWKPGVKATDPIVTLYQGTTLGEALNARDENLIPDPTGKAFVRAWGKTVTPVKAQTQEPIKSASQVTQTQVTQKVPTAQIDTSDLTGKEGDFRKYLVRAKKAGIFTGEVTETGTWSDAQLKKEAPGAWDNYQKALGRQKKETESKATKLVFEEGSIPVPTVAKAQAIELQQNFKDYQTAKAQEMAGTANIGTKVKLKKAEREAKNVWKATASTPGFKKMSKEYGDSLRAFIKDASPAEIAASGLPTVAQIKNDQERNRINEELGNLQFQVAKIQEGAIQGNASAVVLKEMLSGGFQVLNTALEQAKGDPDKLKKIRTDETVNSLLNTLGFLAGQDPEKLWDYLKQGWFGKIATSPTTSNPAALITGKPGAFIDTTSGAQGGKPAWQTAAEEIQNR